MNKLLRSTISPWIFVKKYFSSEAKCHGFTYHKRFSEELTEPSGPVCKLFMVTRVKTFFGAPYWEKNILAEFGLLDKRKKIAIVKNIPEINAKLWKIKHLIKVKPITFPYGPPSDEDVEATYLKENGECIVAKSLKISEPVIEASNNFTNNETRMDGKTLRKYLRLQWVKSYV